MRPEVTYKLSGFVSWASPPLYGLVYGAACRFVTWLFPLSLSRLSPSPLSLASLPQAWGYPMRPEVTYKLSGFVSWCDFLDCELPDLEEPPTAARERRNLQVAGFLQPSTLNPHPSTPNPQPQTPNPRPSTLNLQSSTLYP